MWEFISSSTLIQFHRHKYVQELNDLLVEIGTVPRSQDAILLWPLLLDGGKLLEDARDATFLFDHSKLRVAHHYFSFRPHAFRRIVLSQVVVPVIHAVGCCQY